MKLTESQVSGLRKALAFSAVLVLIAAGFASFAIIERMGFPDSYRLIIYDTKAEIRPIHHIVGKLLVFLCLPIGGVVFIVLVPGLYILLLALLLRPILDRKDYDKVFAGVEQMYIVGRLVQTGIIFIGDLLRRGEDDSAT